MTLTKRNVTIEIQDKGKGIPKKQFAKVFKPFTPPRTSVIGFNTYGAKRVSKRMEGLNNSQIAKKLTKSLNTIKSQIKSIRDKIRI
jgi:nitrogen-specific signal transduction histidine kinase